MIKKLLPTTAVLLVALALGGCAAGSNSPAALLLAQKIESAQTAADHEALAKYYEEAAANARTQAAYHLKLKSIYQGVSARAPHGSTAGPGNAPAYHNTLSNQEDANAKAFDALAAEHHAMATAAK